MPGMRIRAAGMSDAKMAMAAVVTMAAIAVTGGMKKVNGTSMAVAIVADSPGTAPTKRPNAAHAKMVKMVDKLKTSGKASPMCANITENSPWEVVRTADAS